MDLVHIAHQAIARMSALLRESGWVVRDNSFPGVRGLHIKLPNGYTVSVVRGIGTYGSSENLVEVAVFDPAEEFTRDAFLADPGDDVLGWQTTEEAYAIVQRAAAL